VPAISACAAVALIHVTYGVAAAAIAVEDGPTQGPAVSVEIVDP
jgi:hypothetical protein